MTGVRNRIGLVFVLLLILIPAVYVLADEAYIDSDRFTVNTAEIDGDIQFTDVTGCSVRMQVTNHGDDFEGTLKILRYECTDGSYVSAVGRTVHIKSGETQDIYLKLSNIAYDGTPYHVPLRVDFLDKDGQLLCQKITDFQVSPDITTKVAAGVYTDDAQKLAVIDQSRFKYETTNISGDITMKSRQMTDEELANIKQLNINLLILDKVVSESTWENVSEWIMCGGYAMMEKACCQNMIHKMPDDNGLVDWGKGRILVYDASEWNGIMFLKSVRNLFGTDGIHALIAGDYSGYYWNVQTILNYDIASKLPPVTIYFVILLIYILCIGPAVYMILKKRDKREYMWLWIPCLAVLFSVIVYKAGSSTTKGVDADVADAVTEETLDQAVQFVKQFAAKSGSIVAITGAIDLVSDGEKCYVIRNGRPEMGKITGTGCQLSGMMTAFLVANPDNHLEAAAAALCTMGLAGEIGWGRMQEGDGNSTYRNRIIDAVYNMDASTLDKGAKYEVR